MITGRYLQLAMQLFVNAVDDVLMITRNAWQSPAVARQAQCTHPGEDIPLQRSNRLVCCLRDVICNEGVPFRPYRRGVVCTARFCPW